MLQSIDPSRKPRKAKLYLAKPNKDIIISLTDAYNIVYSPKLGNISELTFAISAQIEVHHELVRNPSLVLLKDFFLIKYVCGNITEWFIINQPAKSMSDSGDIKTIHAFSLGYELSFKNVRNYESVSHNAEVVLSEILAETIWEIGFIDPLFISTYRTLTADNKSILEVVIEAAQLYNALILWDTELRTISFYKQEDVGRDLGMRVTYGNLLKGVEETTDTQSMCTRFRPSGLDGIGINSITPTGSSFLEDFSYFIAGYIQDENGNVLAHSPYMSDDLCKSIISYNILVESQSGIFASLLSQLKNEQVILTTKNNELDVLQIGMNAITDNLDIAQVAGSPTANILIQKANQQSLMNNKNAEIVTANANIVATKLQMTNLQLLISISNNFTLAQIKERSQYIIEKDWQNSNYWDAQDLYDASLIEFDKVRVPQISVTMDVVNFLEILEMQYNWDKLNLGDLISVYYDKLDINIQAKIIEFQINHEDGGISLTIANVQEIISDEQKFIDDLYKSISTSNVVQINADKWSTIDNVRLELSDFLENAFKSAGQTITAGTNESVLINRRGITAFDPNNPSHMVRLNSNALLLSTDFGETVSTAITGMGIIKEEIKFIILN